MAISQTPAALPTGTLVNGRFRVKKLLGYGGYGNVYLVEDEAVFLGNQYALKESLSSTISERRQFTREAKWLMSLEHPNLPRVAEQFEWNGRPYFVMAYVAGENLEDRVDRLGALPEDQVLAWMRPICEAVSYLHNQKRPIIHRDIKPGNIIVTKDGRPWLVDFGIAKVLQSGSSRKTTRAARAVSGGYSPLEQYTRGGTDARSDVYALGATLYHLLTGVCPPEAPDIVSGVARLPDVRQVNSKVSRQTEQAVMKAMRQKPEERFQSVQELLDALPGGPSPSASIAPAPANKRAAKSKAAPVPAAPDPVPQPAAVAAPAAVTPPPFAPPIPPAATIVGPPPHSPPYAPSASWSPPAAISGSNAAVPQPFQRASTGTQPFLTPPQMSMLPPDKQVMPRRRRVVLAGVVSILCGLGIMGTIVLALMYQNQPLPFYVTGYTALSDPSLLFTFVLALVPLGALALVALPIFHWVRMPGRILTYILLLVISLLGLTAVISWIIAISSPDLSSILTGLFERGFYIPFLFFLIAWATALVQLVRRR
jgi:serine/threonine protein kinase